MKHVYLYIIIAILALLSACAPEKPTDQEILDSRTVTDLEVSYSMGGAAVQTLEFSHFAGTKTLDVQLNDNNLVWNIVSDQEWCQVISSSGKGPGQAVIKVDTNDGFVARDPATLTFVAGDFRGFTLTVSQSATAFILSQPYFLSSKGGDDFIVLVTTEGGTEWDYVSDDFLTVTPANTETDGEYVTTTLMLHAADNANASRMGKVTLKSGAESEYIYVYQFGTEYNYDESGNILLPGTASSVSLTVPEFAVADVIVPGKYVNYEMGEAMDGFCTLKLSLGDNLSDCSEQREVETALLLSNASASLVLLPVFVQDYIPANGLVTAKGMQLFAAAVAAGESTAVWETDGIVCLKGDIDMDGVNDWSGIGTLARPFKGHFDGGNYAVLNLRNATSGLFNFSEDATIRNISLGKGSSVVNKKVFGATGCLGAIVSVAKNTELTNCRLLGEVNFGGTSENDDPLVYVGGIVGWADAQSRISGAKVTGKVTVSSASGSDVTCYLGGIAGLCEGAVSGCEMLGTASFSSGINTVYAGGIEAALPASSQVERNSFMGTLSLGGSAGTAVLGGLYGLMASDRSFDATLDVSAIQGAIELNSFRAAATTCIYAGGFTGQVAPGVSLGLKGYSAQTNISVIPSGYTAKYLCEGGFLGGCDPAGKAGLLTFEGLTSSGVLSGRYETAVAITVRRNWLGGIAGYVNGAANFSNCTNLGKIGASDGADYCAKSNGYGEICGGIAGYAHGGDVNFTKCTNQADITNHMYNNNGVTGVSEGMYTPPVGGGILGAFNYGTTVESYKLTITDCVNTKNIFGYRGYNGGIVGYCLNADISGCKNTGRLSNGANDQTAYRGGIAGAAGNANITDCQSNADVAALVYGSADYGCAGGILGLVCGDEAVTITGCAAYGTISADKKATTKPEYPGGILGMGSDETTITNCRFGGKVQGIEVTEDNVDTPAIVVGNGLGTLSGISYWNGK